MWSKQTSKKDDPIRIETNMPALILNEDLHRPNKKISIAQMLSADNQNTLISNRTIDEKFEYQSQVVDNFELNERLKARLRLL